MLKVIKCEKEEIKKNPVLYKQILDVYGEKEIEIYGVINNHNKVNFFCLGEKIGLYINSSEFRLFNIDDNYNVSYYQTEKYDVYLNGVMRFVDLNNKQYTLEVLPLDEKDGDEYTGEATFSQRNLNNDSLCELSFHQIYRQENGSPQLFPQQRKKLLRVYFEDNGGDDSSKRFGLIPPGVQDFNLCCYERGTIQFYIANLAVLLLQNKMELETMAEFKKYSKSLFIFNDQFCDFSPFSDFYDIEKVEAMIVDRGFLKEIPQEILTIYNNQDNMLREIKEVLRMLKNKEIENDYVMEMRLAFSS